MTTAPTASGTSAVANGTSAVANGHRTREPQYNIAGPELFCPPSSAFQGGAPATPEWAQELREWWTATADADITSSLDKIVAYGGSGAAYDLISTGRDLAAMAGREVGDEEAIELGILFYVRSKLARWWAAAMDGRRPSDDTLLDSAFYIGMARRNRAVGGWPVKSA